MIAVNPAYVGGTHYHGIVANNSICILNLTRLTIRYLNSLISHSPGNIATKKGNKKLPLELWMIIIDWAKMDPRSDIYCLVQAQSLEQHGDRLMLTCAKITEWNRCGLLETEEVAEEYCNYLRCPGEGRDSKRPFVLPDTTNLDSLITIKESLSSPGDLILFCCIKAYDVIARIEGGDCSLCQGERWIDEFGENGGRRFFGYSDDFKGYQRWDDDDSIIGCPLCIGLGVRPVYDGPRTPQNDMQEEELEAVQTYDERLRKRFWELGYDYGTPDLYHW